MKNLYAQYTSIMIIITALFACRKTNENSITPSSPATGVIASVAGRVVDLSNVPVNGASVTAGISATITDAKGQFFFIKTPVS